MKWRRKLRRKAVEMPGLWETWKTRRRFPTFPTAPWKSPTTRFPHSHRAGDDSPLSEPKTNASRLAPFGRSPQRQESEAAA